MSSTSYKAGTGMLSREARHVSMSEMAERMMVT